MALAAITAACGRADTPAPAEPPARGVLSAEWIYTPATAETEAATGAVTVEASIGADGPARTIIPARGARVRAVLKGPIAMDEALAAALAQRASPMLYVVAEGNVCTDAQATHLVWSEPELVEGRTLAVAALAGGAPGETGSTVCRVLRYTRNRGAHAEGVR